MRLPGTRTKKGMVNLALREYVESRRRAEARLRHFRNAQEWGEAAFWEQHAAEKKGPAADSGRMGAA